MIRAVFVWLVFLWPSTSLASDPVLLASEGDFPPFNFIDPAGNLRGFERDLGDELCRRAELDCIWVITSWDGIIDGLQRGDYDAILAGMAATSDRARVIDFSDEYMPGGSNATFAARHSFIDLRTSRIAVQTGTVQHRWLLDNGYAAVPFDRTEDAVAALWSGTADAVFADGTYINAAQASLSGRLSMLDSVTIPTPGTAIGLQRGDSVLRTTFNLALSEMRSDGALERLVKKWFTPGTAEF